MISIPGLAPIVGVLVLLELGAGTVAAAWISDLWSTVGRGFAGTTALICVVILGTELIMLAALPDPSQLLHRHVDAADYATFVHWSVISTVATAGYAFFSAVGTDPARRVVGAVAVGCGGVAVARAAIVFGPSLGGAGIAVVTFAPAALLGGAVLAGMLLGHWYLIAPDLSFAPLRRAVYLIFSAVAVQAASIAAAVALASRPTRSQLITGHNGLAFWLLVVTAGVVATAAVNGLTLYYARIRANQPATAMLYILIITVLMGIVPAHLLAFLTRVGV